MPDSDEFFVGYIRDAEKRLREQQGTPDDVLLVVLTKALTRQTRAIEALPDALATRLTAPEPGSAPEAPNALRGRLRQAAPPVGWLSAGAVLGYLADLFKGIMGR